ncbi:MAG: MBOAT family protein, partial [Sediminibacterium sp.]
IHACGFLPLLLLNRNRKHVTDVVAQNRKLPNLKELWQMSSTFAFVTFAWIFFRADGMNIALGYIKHIGVSILEHPGQFLILPGGKMAFVYIIPLILGDWYLRRDERKLNHPNKKLLQILIYILVLNLILQKFHNFNSFIYFQF